MGKYEDLLNENKEDVTFLSPRREEEKKADINTSENTETPAIQSQDTDVKHMNLYKVFGLDPKEVKDSEKDKLTFIYKSLNLNSESAFPKIKNVETKIGEPPSGVSRVDHVYGYLKILTKAKRMMSLAKQYEVNSPEPIKVNEDITEG